MNKLKALGIAILLTVIGLTVIVVIPFLAILFWVVIGVGILYVLIEDYLQTKDE